MTATGNFISIKYRLPLLICALLVVFAAALFWAASREVKRSALEGANTRLNAVSTQMTQLLETSAQQMRTNIHVPAHRLPVVSFLGHGDSASQKRAQAHLDTIRSTSPQTIGLEIWGPDAKPLIAATQGIRTESHESAQELASRITDSDTAVVGAFHFMRDSTGQQRIHYPIVAAVRDSSGLLGYFVVHRRLNSSSQGMEQIRNLIGSEVGLYVGSPETGIWTDMTTQVQAPPVRVLGADTLMQYHRDSTGWRLASAQSVDGTPWVALLEFPRDPVLQATRNFTGKFAAIGVVLLLLGGLGAYGLSRDITRPIQRLAKEAEAVASGDYKRAAAIIRRDEIGVLAGAFNSMAQNVGDSIDRLANDIQERKKAEEALLEADERIRAMVEASPLPILSIDVAGNVKSWNRAAERVFGWSAREVVGRPLPTAGTDEQKAEHNSLRERAMKGEVFTGLEIKRAGRNGQPLHLKLSCGATYDGKGEATGVTAVFEDVTQSRKLEEQLRQAQKMEAVGRLAGGIAHDFNNLLTVVLGASDMLLQDIPDSDENHGVVKEIKEAGERAAGLTSQLLAFSRKQLVEPKVFVVNQLVTNMDKMLRRLIGEDVEVSVRLEPELGSVKADIGHVEQVLVNLVVNARDAMPRGGLIIIETRNVTLDEHYVHLHEGVKPGEYVMLAVSDTGIGMTEETKLHIFEPFFTTKEAGKGTGLGLATCYGIVKQAGGHIGVYSEQGVGTTMKVYLPKVARNGAAVTAVPEQIRRGTETILLVEDDKAVRGITRRMLLSQGYTVLEASDGKTALDLLRANGRQVDLLLTDVVLPGMGGREVAEEARAVKPDIKVLFVSGYTDDVILQNQLLERDVSLLQKPFTPQALARKLRASFEGSKED